MSQSLSKIYIHLIFHKRTTSPKVAEEDLEQLHAFIGQIINDSGCKNIWVNGTNDHVHALFELSREVAISNLVGEVKRNSSRWIKILSPRYYRDFSWQGGYAAYSVSQSIIEKTLNYIKTQKEHHEKKTFQEEYIEFLKLYGLDYDEGFVFRD